MNVDEETLLHGLHAKLAWIDSLHPHRGIRADGEAISILSSKDGHLQGAHTKKKHHNGSHFVKETTGTLPASDNLWNPKVERWQNIQLPFPALDGEVD